MFERSSSGAVAGLMEDAPSKRPGTQFWLFKLCLLTFPPTLLKSPQKNALQFPCSEGKLWLGDIEPHFF